MYIEKLLQNESIYVKILDIVMKEYNKDYVALWGSLAQENRKERKLFVESLYMLDGKVYARVISNTGKRFYVNDFGAYYKLTRVFRKDAYTKEEMKLLNRQYTKFMLWANFANREEYCQNYIKEAIFQNRYNVRGKSLERRKELTNKVKVESDELLRELTKEIVDEMMYYKFFEHQYSIKRNQGNFLHTRKPNYTPEESEFFDSHLDYIATLINDNFEEYNQQTQSYDSNSRRLMDSADVQDMLKTRSFRPFLRCARTGGEMDHLREYAATTMNNAAHMHQVSEVPFAAYIEAYDYIYGGKDSAREQARQ